MSHDKTDIKDEMFNKLRTGFAVALREFDASSSTFKILHSISDSAVSPCGTLYVLDSSFNPPSKAHALLAENAVQRDVGRKPARVLLLLATTNADKAVKPALFEDRVAMMTLMARSLHHSLEKTPIDIGVTKKPFFVDKAKSIDESNVYGDAEQVHLTGFDTITRIFDSKYYPADQKLSVLNPFLTRHRLRVNYRLDDKFGSREDQDKYLEGISDGSREDEGMQSEWRDRIAMANDAEAGSGMSSTQARKAVRDGNAEKAREFVSEAVAEYMIEMKLYHDDETET